MDKEARNLLATCHAIICGLIRAQYQEKGLSFTEDEIERHAWGVIAILASEKMKR